MHGGILRLSVCHDRANATDPMSLSLSDALDCVPTSALESMDTWFDDTRASSNCGMAIIRSTLVSNGQTVFIVAVGGEGVTEMVHVALERRQIQDPKDLERAREIHGENTFFVYELHKFDSEGNRRLGSLRATSKDREHAECLALAKKSEEKIIAFLDDTPPYNHLFYVDGNIDLRTLVSSSPRAVEIRSNAKKESTPGPPKRRRVAVKTEDDA